MRTLVTVLLTAVVLFPLTAGATIINIPGDYPTIQEGIDNGLDGDTVLVQPDTYFENLNFNGHNVVLASLFLTTGDTAYISNTIIDGSQSGSVIIFWHGEDSTAQVVGFRIENGYADHGGGIDCYYNSSPTISGNIVQGNSAALGGGICCRANSSPEIRSNSINCNSADFLGGGVLCLYSSSPTIRDNTISGNSADSIGGSGIACAFLSNPTVSNNTVSHNSSDLDGGGIHCHGSNPIISYNTITSNSAVGDGGGIVCEANSNPRISNNTISENSAHGGYGGGINCSASGPAIINNTIVENSADVGGGICCSYVSNPTITNTICWGDSANYTPEIWSDTSSSPVISYCNIQDTLWPGSGNIDEDPIFVGPYNEDFCLRWRSPCIDAGHPNPIYNDPDGTRNDMGACYFKQDVAGIVEVYPHDTLIVIPPEGGDLIYDGWVFNFFGHAGRVDIWTYAFVPEMGQYGPLALYENVRIPADSLGRNGITEHVPGIAPEGDYVFVAYVGDYPSTIIDSSCFYFTKAGSIAGGIADWQTLKGWFEGEFLSTESGLPTHYTLSQNYPNPFNTTTTINYQLPVDGHVKLEAYNTLGQKVATLVDEKQKAGYRLVNWDASEVSSGLYFYKLTAGDYTQTKRMMLVR